MVESAIDTLTCAGTGMGLRPIRDMGVGSSRFSSGRRLRRSLRGAGSDWSLMDHRQDLAADLLGACPAVAQDAARGAQNVDPHSAEDRLELLVASIDAAAGLAHAVDPGDEPLAVGA